MSGLLLTGEVNDRCDQLDRFLNYFGCQSTCNRNIGASGAEWPSGARVDRETRERHVPAAGARIL